MSVNFDFSAGAVGGLPASRPMESDASAINESTETSSINSRKVQRGAGSLSSADHTVGNSGHKAAESGDDLSQQIQSLRNELSDAQVAIAKRDAALSRGRAAWLQEKEQNATLRTELESLRKTGTGPATAGAEATHHTLERSIEHKKEVEALTAERDEARMALVVLRRKVASSVLSGWGRRVDSARARASLWQWRRYTAAQVTGQEEAQVKELQGQLQEARLDLAAVTEQATVQVTELNEQLSAAARQIGQQAKVVEDLNTEITALRSQLDDATSVRSQSTSDDLAAQVELVRQLQHTAQVQGAALALCQQQLEQALASEKHARGQATANSEELAVCIDKLASLQSLLDMFKSRLQVAQAENEQMVERSSAATAACEQKLLQTAEDYSSLQRQHATLQDQLLQASASHAAAVRSVERERDVTVQDVQALSASLSDLQAQVEVYKKGMGTAVGDTNDLRLQLQETTQLHSQLLSRYEEQSERLKHCQADLMEAQNQVCKYSTQQQELLGETMTLREQLRDQAVLLFDSEGRVAVLSTKLATSEEGHLTASATAARLEQLLALRSAELQESRSLLEELKTQVNAPEATAVAISRAVSDASGEAHGVGIESLEEDASTATANSLQSLRSQIEALESERSTLHSEIAQLQCEVQSCMDRAAVAEQGHARATAESHQLQARVDQLTTQVAALSAASNSTSGHLPDSYQVRELRELKVRLIDMSTDLELSRAQVARLEKRCEELQLLAAQPGSPEAGGRSSPRSPKPEGQSGIDSVLLRPSTTAVPSPYKEASSPALLLAQAEVSNLNVQLDGARSECSQLQLQCSHLHVQLEDALFACTHLRHKCGLTILAKVEAIRRQRQAMHAWSVLRRNSAFAHTASAGTSGIVYPPMSALSSELDKDQELQEAEDTVVNLKRDIEWLESSRSSSNEQWREAAAHAEQAVHAAMALKTEAETAVSRISHRLAEAERDLAQAREAASQFEHRLQDAQMSAKTHHDSSLAYAMREMEISLSRSMAEADALRARVASAEAARADADARALSSLQLAASPQSPDANRPGRFPLSTALVDALQVKDEVSKELQQAKEELRHLRSQCRSASADATAHASILLRLEFFSIVGPTGDKYTSSCGAVARDLETMLSAEGRVRVEDMEEQQKFTLVTIAILPANSLNDVSVVEIAALLQMLCSPKCVVSLRGPFSRWIDRDCGVHVTYTSAQKPQAGLRSSTEFDELQSQLQESEIRLMSAALQVEAQDAQIQDLSVRVIRAEEELKEAHSRTASAVEEAKQLRHSAAEALQSAHAAQMSCDAAVEAELGATLSLASAQAEIERLQAELRDASLQTETAQVLANEAQLALGSVKAQLSQAHEALRQRDIEHAQVISGLVRESLQGTEDSVAQLQAVRDTAAKLEQEKAQLKDMLSTQNAANVEEWRTALGFNNPADASLCIEQLKAQIRQAQQDVVAAESQNASLQAELRRLHADGVQSIDKDALTAELSACQAALAELQGAKRRWDAEDSALKERLSRTLAELESTKLASRTLAAELPGLRAEFSFLERDNAVLKEANEELQGALRQAQAALMQAATAMPRVMHRQSVPQAEVQADADELHHTKQQLVHAHALLAALGHQQAEQRAGDDDSVQGIPEPQLTSLPESAVGEDTATPLTPHVAILTAAPQVRQSFMALQGQLRRALTERDAVRAELAAVVQAAVSAVIQSPGKQDEDVDSQRENTLATPAPVAASLHALRGRVSQLETALQAAILREAHGHTSPAAASPGRRTNRASASTSTGQPRRIVAPASPESKSPRTARSIVAASLRPMPDASSMQHLLQNRQVVGKTG